jgi:cellulose synthase/poly-beta-1,6-N-acetylglucosamine synthase-like glycosyltransferase
MPCALSVPHADYVLTLDADSVLLPGYCVRLVNELEQPGNERVAVAQTPYSAFPGAPTPLERVAGATTDLQHLQHQGKTRFDATFWVGANAVIRAEALADIAQVRRENGILVRTFIQDRTVIEDTESSIDLAIQGWSLTNYPARLSYSATPSDFGSLVVQRRRWANGGLIIMPKLRSLLRARRRRGERTSLAEIALRTDYLGSIAATSFGVVLMQLVMLVPGTATVVSPVALLAMVPYLVGQALDLRRLGYPARLVLWVSGLNFALVMVNLAGALKSIQQGVTGRKIPFARTPKVRDRTAAPALYVVAAYLAGPYLLLISWVAAQMNRWPVSVVATTTALVAIIAAMAFVPPRSAWEDVKAGRPVRRSRV